VARARKYPPDGQADRSRQVVSLVEPALQSPPRVKRHRNESVGASEHGFTSLLHQLREWTGKHAASLVLERMDDLPE